MHRDHSPGTDGATTSCRRAALVDRQRQREREGRADPHLTLDPDPSAMELDELARDGEAEPGAFDSSSPPSRPAGTPRTPPPDPPARCPPRCRSPKSPPRRRARAARTSICPPSGVNFSALDRRFSSTCFTLRSSARIIPRRSSIVLHSAMPRRCARSRTRISVFSMALGRSKSRRLQLHPPRLDLGQVEDVVDERQQVPSRLQNVARGIRPACR